MENNQFAFLDAQLTVKHDFTFGFSIFRKNTHTDRYLNFSSNHPLHHKISVIDSLVTRALRICDSENLNGELEHITLALTRNGYPKQMIDSRIDYHKYKPLSIPKISKENDMPKRLVLPYTGRITMEIAHIVRNNTELEVAFRPINKISTFLNNNRTKNKDQIGVYKFPCNSCPSVYIGETGRNLPVRLAEHMRDIRNNKDTSGPYIHIRDNPSHHFDVNDALLIDAEKRHHLRKFKESLYIAKSTSYNCNLESGIYINPIWSATVLKFIKSP